jgi:hypothetical protein
MCIPLIWLELWWCHYFHFPLWMVLINPHLSSSSNVILSLSQAMELVRMCSHDFPLLIMHLAWLEFGRKIVNVQTVC